MAVAPGAADRDAADRPLLPPSWQERLRPVARMIIGIESVLGSALLAAIAGLLMMQVFGRNVLSSTFFWADEVARLSLIWMTMVGLAYAVGKGSHLTVTAVTDYLPEGVRVWFQRLALVLIGAVGILLAPAAADLMQSIGGVAASSSGIPRSVFFLASVIGYGLAVLQSAIVLLIGPERDSAGPAEQVAADEAINDIGEAK